MTSPIRNRPRAVPGPAVSRRDALRSMGVIGVSSAMYPGWVPRLVFSPTSGGVGAQRDVLVAIFQRGGMDGLNVVVPYGEGAGYYDRRPTIGIAEPDGGEQSAIDLNGFFGLHPALRPMKAIYDDDALTVIHAAGSPDPSRSHFDAMEYMERGIPGDKTTANGWITRHLETAAWENESPFRAVGMGALIPSSLRGEHSALALRSIADFHLVGREEHLGRIQRTLSGLYTVNAPSDLLQSQAAEVFNAMDLLNQLALEEYVPANEAEYPESEFGEGLQQIAHLIKADVGLEVACVDIGGWDTHESQGAADGELANLLDDFARGMAAFYADMYDEMPRITVVSMSEFGRRVEENASGGTDHGHGNCMFIMGGGAQSQVYADWRGLAPEALDEGDLAVTTDYRDILAEVLSKRVLNTHLDQIFPNYTPVIHDLLRSR